MSSPYPIDQDASQFRQDRDPFDDTGPNYRRLRIAFTLGAIALGFQSAEIVLRLLATFGGVRELAFLLRNPRWGIFIGTPITWAAALSAYLLIGGWREPRWNRRVGLLALMNSVDLLFWASDCGPELGLRLVAINDEFVRYVGSILQWFELWLFAALASNVAFRLGRPEALTHQRSARSFCLMGLVVWTLVLFGGTNWATWPPHFQITTVETFLLYMGSSAILGLAAFQVMLLCTLAARCSGRRLGELRATDRDHELLRTRSENSQDWPSHEDDPWR